MACDRCGRRLRSDNVTGRCAYCQRGGRPPVCPVCATRRVPPGRSGGWCDDCQLEVAPVMAYLVGGGKRPPADELPGLLARYAARAAAGLPLFGGGS